MRFPIVLKLKVKNIQYQIRFPTIYNFSILNNFFSMTIKIYFLQISCGTRNKITWHILLTNTNGLTWNMLSLFSRSTPPQKVRKLFHKLYPPLSSNPVISLTLSVVHFDVRWLSGQMVRIKSIVNIFEYCDLGASATPFWRAKLAIFTNYKYTIEYTIDYIHLTILLVQRKTQ